MKIFGGSKPDHPLADPKEAKRLLDALPTNDPVKALDELTHWVESVAALEGFKPEVRIQLLITLDDTAQTFLRKLSKDYFVSARCPPVRHASTRTGSGPRCTATGSRPDTPSRAR